MIAVDSCVWIDYFEGSKKSSVSQLESLIEREQAVIPPVVVAELLSNPNPHLEINAKLKRMAVLEIQQGFWERAGLLRAQVRKLGLKATLGDALVAQSCIDHGVPLLTTDKDFRHYVKAGGLKLVK